MTLISELYAEALALYYGGEVSYHHLNKWSMWEFRIYNINGLVYTSKGLRR